MNMIGTSRYVINMTYTGTYSDWNDWYVTLENSSVLVHPIFNY